MKRKDITMIKALTPQPLTDFQEMALIFLEGDIDELANTNSHVFCYHKSQGVKRETED